MKNVLNDRNGNNIPVILFWLPYTEVNGGQLLNYCVKKIRRSYQFNIKFRVICDTRKHTFYYNMKGKIPHEQKHHVKYALTCPGCSGKYISKTDRYLLVHMNEHGTSDTEPMFKHLSEC